MPVISKILPERNNSGAAAANTRDDFDLANYRARHIATAFHIAPRLAAAVARLHFGEAQ
jgi:hypothetical protein